MSPPAPAQYAGPTPPRVSVIDLGSNALRLAVFELDAEGDLDQVEWMRHRVRLSEGMETGEGRLQDAPVSRTLDSLEEMAETAAEHLGTVVAVATSAVRDAANSDEFLRVVEERTGLRLRVLSARDEAYYSYLAVVGSLPVKSGWVVEIGGGSVQVSALSDGRMIDTTSAPLGAVRALERQPLSDPPRPAELALLREWLEREIEATGLPEREPGELVGVSGTMRTLGRMDAIATGVGDDELHGRHVPSSSVDEVVARLSQMSTAERRREPGMEPDRADVILAGLVLLQLLLQRGGFEGVTVSVYGIREGLALEALGKTDRGDTTSGDEAAASGP